MAALAASACTLALDISPVQCRRNQDCAKFVGAVCDTAARICRPSPGSTAETIPDGGAAAHDGGAGNVGSPDTLGAGGGDGPDGASASAPENACRGVDGCLSCGPAPASAFQNRCTDVTCVPFDNRARLSNLGADGGLMPLP